MQNNYLTKIIITIFLITVTSQVFANENNEEGQSLWEIAVGAGVVHQSYYTGTKQTRQFAFPLVKPTYRGKFFKSDDKGVRAELFKRGRFQLDLSADINLSVDSDEMIVSSFLIFLFVAYLRSEMSLKQRVLMCLQISIIAVILNCSITSGNLEYL